MRFGVAFTLTARVRELGVYVSQAWRGDLEEAIGPVMSWVIPLLLAYVPSVLIGFMVFTLFTTRYRPPELDAPKGPWPDGQWPSVTLIVAAWNEEEAIVPTLERIADLSYPGLLEIVLADNDSTDSTAERARAAAVDTTCNIGGSLSLRPGKYSALNAALATVTTPLVATVDADTLLHGDALTRLVARIASRPQDQHVCACAGALVAGNVQANFLTRMQSWDYRLGINGVKRMQAAYNSTLVAQGAFSAYWTDDIRAVGGWPDAIGEDIVLTWTLMLSRGIVQYEPTALALTNVPERASPLHASAIALGARHVRGSAEQSAAFASPACSRSSSRVSTTWCPSSTSARLLLGAGSDPVPVRLPADLLVVVDAPDSGHPAIYGLLRRWQERHVFRPLGVVSERDTGGYLGYLFAYQAVASPAALRGYWQFLSGAARRWK